MRVDYRGGLGIVGWNIVNLVHQRFLIGRVVVVGLDRLWLVEGQSLRIGR